MKEKEGINMLSMVSTSNKKISTLLKDFTRHPREFESYSKHCRNILNSFVWLKEHQYDSSVDSYDYLVKLLQHYSYSDYILQSMLVDFQKEVVAKVPDDEKTVLHSNLYYYDVTGSMNSLHDLDSLATVNPKNPVYRRLDYTILNPTVDLDLERGYSFDEICKLAQEGVIIVLDNHLSSERSQTQENDGCVYLVHSDPYWIGNESRVVDQLYSFSDPSLRSKWGIIHKPFCQYVKEQCVDFDSDQEKNNQMKDLLLTEKHLQEITDGMIGYYHKHHKPFPKVVAKTIEGNEECLNAVDQAYFSANQVEKSHPMVKSIKSQPNLPL